MEQIRRLEAEESLRNITTVAVGSGSLKKSAASEILRKLQRTAERERGKLETKEAVPLLETVFKVVKEPQNG